MYIKYMQRNEGMIAASFPDPMLGAQSGTSEREWECEVVLCESEMRGGCCSCRGVLWLW